MSRWLQDKGKSATGDVYRWAEKVWKEKGRGKRKKPVLVGMRDVTAQLLDDDGRFLTLLVLKCEILESAWEPLKPLKHGEKIRRKRETIINKGLGHRAKWSEEGARDQVISEFLKPED